MTSIDEINTVDLSYRKIYVQEIDEGKIEPIWFKVELAGSLAGGS